jgi:hypothetical protein
LLFAVLIVLLLTTTGLCSFCTRYRNDFFRGC